MAGCLLLWHNQAKTSQVAQWRRIWWPMKEMWVQFLGQTSLVMGVTKSQTQLGTQTPKQKLSSTLQVAEELVWVQALQILEGILRILDLILKALK